ncbi:hypothetical protein [Streptomyces resistomycificus]|uniref:hypothetical protein n=1 Tax=Streptomyces resistomycificus TaxID=67356 RepID=UPI00068C9A40|nr:hypothetical protein [Streptomyces resistomycificus]
MALRKRDSEFRHLGVSYLDFKRVEMDRVLTGFLMRVNHNGHPSRLTQRHKHESDSFVQEFLDEQHADRFQGFSDHPDMARRWIETQLLDMVNRGKPSQAVAGLRPLHGLTYKFRNYYHSRAYGADAQLYEMLRHARDGRGTLALEAIRGFFFNGLDPALGTPLPGSSLDVETQAVLHLNSQVKHDTPQTVKGWYSAPPLCVGQSDLLADDVLRLLSLRDLLPRIVMVEYLKILFAFHLALGQLKTMKLLTSMVERLGAEPSCGPENCPAGPGQGQDDFAACPFCVGLFVDAAGAPGTCVYKRQARNTGRGAGRTERRGLAAAHPGLRPRRIHGPQTGRIRRAPGEPGRDHQAVQGILHGRRSAPVRGQAPPETA